MRRRPPAGWLRIASMLLLSALALPARAQMGGMGGGRSPQSQPTQTSPVHNNQVGPRAGGPSADDEEDTGGQPFARTEPVIAPPADPLAIPLTLQNRIGSDYMGGPPSPVGELRRTSYFPYYEERRGDYRLRLLPPLWLEQTRGLRAPAGATAPGEPAHEDRQSLFALLYYQRRSLHLDIDTLFPAFWKVRDDDSNLLVLGPFVHREANFEHDNWLAPLYFEGARKDGGYLHLPLLLTASHWSEESAFTYSVLFFRNRRKADVDWGVAPLLFHGRQRQRRGVPQDLHPDPAARVLPPRARDRLDRHDGRRPGGGRDLAQAGHRRCPAALLPHHRQPGDGRRRGVAHDALPVLPLRRDARRAALRRARLPASRDADGRHPSDPRVLARGDPQRRDLAHLHGPDRAALLPLLGPRHRALQHHGRSVLLQSRRARRRGRSRRRSRRGSRPTACRRPGGSCPP